MRILVAVATRHGATREIAENIASAAASALTDAGVWSEADVRDVGRVTSVDGFDAVVFGSAVYMGRWLEPATKFAEAFEENLRRVPVWVFSSGPVGERDESAGDHRDRPSIRAWGREIGLSPAKADLVGSAS